jgi:hypothetical protein
MFKQMVLPRTPISKNNSKNNRLKLKEMRQSDNDAHQLQLKINDIYRA